MDIAQLRVRNYRSIEDSGWVSLEELTCLIGKNESGKTAFMQAVEQLNPAYPTGGYTAYEDYPRQEWPDYSERHEDDPDVVVSARVTLDEADRTAVEDTLGTAVLDGNDATVHMDYQGTFQWDLPLDDAACLKYLPEAYDVPDDDSWTLGEADSLSGVERPVEGLEADPETVVAGDVGAVLVDRLPEFQYIGEGAVMAGTIVVEDLIDRREAGDLDAGDQVFLSLLSVAGLELSELDETDDWRQRTTELEAASASVSDEAMSYWSQSGDVQIRIQGTTIDHGDDERHVVDVRVENRDHNVTVEFEQRSRGFRRFFSTFCQLSDLRSRESDLVVMLDEPGLNLHARAKQEFLEFLKTEVAPESSVVYTTHSPFMIDKANLDRVKMVRADPVGDRNVFADVSLADAYTQFPLRNAFELDLMDTLLVRPQVLLVETKADHVYLYVLSKLLRDTGEDGLDDRWTVIPVEDADNVGQFVALFGEDQLDVATLLNEAPSTGRGRGGTDTLADIPVTTVDEFTDSRDSGTIEDVLSTAFYVEVVNQAYTTAIATTDGVPDRFDVEDLPDSDDPVVERVASYFEAHGINDGTFERGVVALYLQRNRADLAGDVDNETRRNFTRLFTDLNNTLESFEGVESRGASLLETFGL
jgi:energy-coupling factor transporter ATP-binding protein EcfA2